MLGGRSWPSADTDSDVQPARRRPQVERHPGSGSAPLGAYAAGHGLSRQHPRRLPRGDLHHSGLLRHLRLPGAAWSEPRSGWR